MPDGTHPGGRMTVRDTSPLSKCKAEYRGKQSLVNRRWDWGKRVFNREQTVVPEPLENSNGFLVRPHLIYTDAIGL